MRVVISGKELVAALGRMYSAGEQGVDEEARLQIELESLGVVRKDKDSGWPEKKDLREKVAKTIFYYISGMTPEEFEQCMGEHPKWLSIPEWERDDYRFAAKQVLDFLRKENPLFHEKEKSELDSLRSLAQATLRHWRAKDNVTHEDVGETARSVRQQLSGCVKAGYLPS